MKIAVLSANLGSFDNPVENVEQSLSADFYRFTDANFAPRLRSMTPRLQARIPKMFGWQMVPRYDVYIWVDASCALLHPNSVKWLIEKLGDADLAVLRHPNRRTIRDEADYIKKRITAGCKYLTPRYENELVNEQLEEIFSNPNYKDDHLFASTVLVYRNNPRVQAMMKEWWYHTSRYHSVDQLSLPYAIQKSRCTVNIIEDKYTKTPFITHVRKRSNNNFLHR